MPPRQDHSYTVQRLAWSDPELRTIPCPKGPLRISASFGSGLARRATDPPGIVWGVGDRGPNLKVGPAVERYGLEHLRAHGEIQGAKVMPAPDIGPTIAELRVLEDRVELLRLLPLLNPDGRTMTGLPTPAGDHAVSEPALDLRGDPLQPDEGGADTEGIAARPDGGFIIGDEYGPSLLLVDEKGRLQSRWLPGGPDGELPQIAARRQINRGFEAIALSPDGAWLFLAFQSPLAHPTPETHARARHVRIWKMASSDGRVAAQYLYRLDDPESFRRDCAKGEFGRGDVKLCEMACEAEDRLIVLERGSETTKIYRIRLDPSCMLDRSHLEIGTRPTVEEISGEGRPLPEVPKQLLLTTDDCPQVAADMEGMVILSRRELLLVTDNDFGVEGVETSFWRVTFELPELGCG